MFHPATPSESGRKRLFPAHPHQAQEPSAKLLPLRCQPYEGTLVLIARSETLTSGVSPLSSRVRARDSEKCTRTRYIRLDARLCQGKSPHSFDDNRDTGNGRRGHSTRTRILPEAAV